MSRPQQPPIGTPLIVAEETGRKKTDFFDFFPYGGQQIRLFLLTVALVIRSEAVCEDAASILNQHIHGNRALDHESLDEGVMFHWNTPSLYLADPFVKSSSSNKYFFQLKDKHWILFKKLLGEIFRKLFLGRGNF